MKFIVANWKMNGDLLSLIKMYNTLEQCDTKNKIIICPPATMLFATSPANVEIGAQNCSAYDFGAHTGEISAKQIAEMGAKYVIIGHRELNESDDIKHAKAERALSAGLTPIICIENADSSVINYPSSIIAYEPAIFDMTELKRVRKLTNSTLLYGGGVNAKNAAKIMKITDGVLVGGCGLEPDDFLPIIISS